MAILLPAIKSRMGSNDYYISKMRASELATIARAASQKDDWATQGIEERLQRKLNEKRVREEITPYLAKSADRFFGSIIVLVYDPELFEYEEAEQWVSKAPAIYRKVLADFGVLSIEGGDMIVLDGQHRWAALKMVSEKKNDQNDDIEGEFVEAVRNDEVSVIFVKFKTHESTRRMFNKINKSAKPTGRSDDIITSEDDGYAILARRLLNSGEPLGVLNSKKELIVNWKSNTLSDRSAQLTTVSAVYETVKDICKEMPFRFEEKERAVRPEEQELDAAYEEVRHWWSLLLEHIELFREAVDNPNDIPNLRQKHANNLILKPAQHIALVRGLLIATHRYGVDETAAVQRVDKVDWSIGSPLWTDFLVNPAGRIIARNANYNHTAELLAYMISGSAVTSGQKGELEKKLSKDVKGEDSAYTLPKQVS